MPDHSAKHLADYPADYSPSGAVLSSCGRYRYRLWRAWGPGRRVLWVMLNPSTADATTNDATIRRCMGFARLWGYDGIEVVNLFAWRATYPNELKHVADPVGPDNDQHIAEAAAAYPDCIVLAWGAPGGSPRAPVVDVSSSSHLQRSLHVLTGPLAGHAVKCLGECIGGAPRHPVRLAYDTALVEYSLDSQSDSQTNTGDPT